MGKHTLQELKIRQGLPLEAKVRMTQLRIKEWIYEYGVDGVYVAFSGGKDSTVLLYLVREMFPEVPAVFFDTGLEYPEIREFVKTFDNVVWLKPKMSFKKVIDTYGYPFISKRISDSLFGGRKTVEALEIKSVDELKTVDINKLNERTAMLGGRYNEWYINRNGKSPTKNGSQIRNQSKYAFMLFGKYRFSSNCCNVMKKNPAKAYGKKTGRKPITAQMASESELRTQQWLNNGCNGFEMASPISNPMSFWTEQDVLRFIQTRNIKICSVYGEIVPVYEDLEVIDKQMDISDYGLAEDTRKLKTTGCSRTGCMFCGYGCQIGNDDRFSQMKKTHPKQYDYIMKPASEGGLGYKELIEWLNANGNLNIKH